MSTDGGSTWVNGLWAGSKASDTGRACLDISTLAAGKSEVIIRFYFRSSGIVYIFSDPASLQIDDVNLFSACTPPGPGALVIGNVYNSSTQGFLSDAVIDDGLGHETITVATPADPHEEDGFYLMYLPAGDQTITVTKEPYQPVTQNITVPDNGIIQRNLEIHAGDFADYALWFDGTDDHATVNEGSGINLTGPLTIEAWINPLGWGEKPVDGLSKGRIVDKGTFSLSLKSLSAADIGESLLFTVYRDGISIETETVPRSIVLNTWQHVAVTYDGVKTVKIYINGVEQRLIQDGGLLSGPIPDNSGSPLLIGESPEQANAFAGMMDEIRIWNVVRTPFQIETYKYKNLTGNESGLQCYFPNREAGPAIVDESGHENNAAIQGGISLVEGFPVDVLSRIPGGLQFGEHSLDHIEIVWNPPAATLGLAGYNVYRNSIKINPALVTGIHFTDSDVTVSEIYTYTVTAVYEKESQPSNAIQIKPHDPIIFVNAAAAGENTGRSWQDAFTNVQPALQIAIQGDEIWVAAGTYTPDYDVETGSYTSSYGSAFALKNGVAMFGGFQGTETERSQRDWRVNKTILSGDIKEPKNFRFFSIAVVSASLVDNTTILDGFIISGGYGGFFAYGGGMYCRFSSPTISNIVFSNNSTGSCGGAGLYNYYSSPVVNQVTFFGNETSASGGGIYNENSNPVLTQVTLAGNSADEQGGGIYNTHNSHPVITNSILWDNTAAEVSNQVYDLPEGEDWYGNPVPASSTAITYSMVQGGWEGEGNRDADPLFADVQNGDLHLSPGSPAIGVGSNSLIPKDVHDLDGDGNTGEPLPFDLDKKSRMAGSLVDMGAFEYPLYSIIAAASGSGSISPQGEVKVSEGLDQTFTINPADGFEVDMLVVDGHPASLADGKYTFASVAANHDLLAIFKSVLTPDFQSPAYGENQVEVSDLTIQVEAEGRAVDIEILDAETLAVVFRALNTAGEVVIPKTALKTGQTEYLWKAKFSDADAWTPLHPFTTEEKNPLEEAQRTDDQSIDLDDDGSPDISQENFKLIKSDDRFIGLKGSDQTQIESIVAVKIVNLVFGIGISFRAAAAQPGDMAEMTLYLDQSAGEGRRLVWQTPDGRSAADAYQIGEDGKTVTIRICDGGKYDADGVKNGIVVLSESGLFLLAESGSSNFFNKDGNACFIRLLTPGFLKQR